MNDKTIGHRLVSPFILEKYAAGENSGQFQAAALFVDMSGFSTMTSKLMEHGQHGAEVMAIVMRAIFDPLVEAVYAHAGFITTFAGDAFTAVFPLNHAAPQETYAHALATAWTIRNHMRNHAWHETPYGKFEVGVKVGMAAGEVTWGILRAEDDTRATFYFRGPAIDASAHAEHHANKGDVILDASAAGQLADSVATIALVEEHVRVEDVTSPLPNAFPVLLPAPDPALSTRFFPAPVVEQTYTGEFREALTVFINVRGAPTEAQLSEFMASVFKLQDKYGGLFNRLDFGDKGCSVLMFWGAPVRHENDVVRALNFLLELHEQTRLSIRAGVTSRISHAGFIGSNLHEEYTCYGNGVNLAARLMTSAPWESFWLDQQIASLASYQFELENEGSYAFKGFAEPQSVFALLGRKAPDILNIYERPMVGRTTELNQLRDFVQPMFNDTFDRRFAGILVVEGEAGIGKSRLIHEFIQSEPINRVCKILTAQTDQILRSPLNPFVHWLRNYFDQSSTQSEAYNRRTFSRKLNQLLTELPDSHLRVEIDRTHSVLGALIDLHWENSLYEQLDPQSRYETTFTSLKNLILAESLINPVILLVEDAHWMDEESINFIEHLVRNIEKYPLVLLVTTRPDNNKKVFGEAISYQTLELKTLPLEEINLLAAELMGASITSDLSDLLAERAGGNPFFAEQILLYLREEGMIERVDDEWRVGNLRVTSLLPSNLRVIFTARLDRLTRNVKEVVQTAAVLGREFEVQVLSHMLHHEHVAHSLDMAEEAAIWEPLSEIRYLFKHVLLRDAAYDMQVLARRASLHQLAGHALETVFADDLAAHVVELSYHYESAALGGLNEVRNQARQYLQNAGEQASERYENTTAIHYITRALNLIAENNLRDRFDLLSMRSKLYDTRGEREAEKQDLEAMDQLANALNDDNLRLKVAQRWANHYEETGEFQAGINATKRALELARAVDNVNDQIHSMYLQASILYRLGDFSNAISTCEEGLALARKHKLIMQEADLLVVLSFSLDVQGTSIQALEALEQALAIFRNVNDPMGVMATLNSIGIAEYGIGRYGNALTHFNEAIKLARETGRRKGEARYLGNVGQLQIALGNLREARNHLERALFLNREIGNRDSEAINWGNMGVVATKCGDFEAAHDFFSKAIMIGKEINDKLLVCETLAYWGLLDVYQNDLSGALQRCTEAIPLAKELSSPMHEGLIWMVQGHANLAAGKPNEALAAYQTSLAVRENMGLFGYVAEPRAGLARAYLAVGNQAAALEQVRPIVEFFATHNDHLTHGLVGAEDALWIYLTCYQMLAAVKDERADALLQRAHALLQTEIAQFETDAEKSCYLEATSYRRDIIAAYKNLASESVSHQAVGEVQAAQTNPMIDLTSGDLAHAKLAGETLRGLSLRGADLSHADLQRADLSYCDLRGADLSHANLRGADLSGTDLRRVDLTAADLRATDFTGANLQGANLEDVTWDGKTRWPAGFVLATE